MSLALFEQNRTDLLRLLGEPQSGRIFTQEDLDHLLAEANNLNDAASAGWLMKADRLISHLPVSSIGLGSESYKFQSASEILDYCKERSRHYAKLAGMVTGMVFSMQPGTSGEGS